MLCKADSYVAPQHYSDALLPKIQIKGNTKEKRTATDLSSQ